MGNTSKEGKLMKEVWDSLEIGDTVTGNDLISLADLPVNELTQKRSWAVLNYRRKIGEATVTKNSDDLNVWKKIKNGKKVKKTTAAAVPTPGSGAKHTDKVRLDEIGEAVVQKIIQYRNKNTELEKKVKQLEGEVRDHQLTITKLQGRLNGIKSGAIQLKDL